MNRGHRANEASQTLQILEEGHYDNAKGKQVDIGRAMAESIAATRVITPDEWPKIQGEARTLSNSPLAPIVEVTGETTLQAAHRLIVQQGESHVLALNFASAKNPGGGFLSGSQAQEESLARASGLYRTLLAGQRYYDANRAVSSKLYTDHAILSPRVPVIRNDAGDLLDRPFLLTFLTMPAPNLGAIGNNDQERLAVPGSFRRRMNNLFALAATTGHISLILGAWGCGVFRNDPAIVAQLFDESLFGEAAWGRLFHRICFAVYDTSAGAQVHLAFEDCFAVRMAGKSQRR
jgi:uncharacterized protein (TIGR02452 family)